MPISNPNYLSEFNPKSDYRIAKYLDLTKFISLLHQESLFFCRLDKLEDGFEGTYPKLSIQKRMEYDKNLYKKSHKQKNQSSTELEKSNSNQLEWDQKFKSLICVCCWNKSEKESIALWKIYSNFQKGIMITTSIDKLKNSFTLTKEDVNLVKVKYIDYKTDYIPFDTFTKPAFHKHEAYHFEEEVRLIYTVKFEGGLTYDWSKEEVNQGKYLNINIKELIDEIIISPYSPNWYCELVQDIVNKYGLDIKIKKSELTYPE